MLIRAAVAFFLAISPAAAVAGGIVSGVPSRVVDGDTFDVSGVRIRLCGIDAPEMDHRGGKEARRTLASIIGSTNVRCTPVGAGTPCDGRSRTWNRGRLVAQCFARGRDVAAELVRRGAARDWPRFSGGHYSATDIKRIFQIIRELREAKALVSAA